VALVGSAVSEESAEGAGFLEWAEL
jgi:hypothetical protein